MAPNFLQTAKSAVVVLCLANYILVPFDTQIMKSVIDLNWPNLVAYVLIEQLFLATFRRLDFRIAGYISMVTALAQLQLRKNQTTLLKAEEMGLLLPIVIDAASNVAVLVLAINLSNPARPNLPIFEYASLQVIFGSYALLKWVPPVEYPFKVVFVSGTWEQVRLLTSVLFLRIATGGLLQAIVLTFSEQSELRIGIIRSKCNLDLDEPSSDSKGDVKPRKKFAVHINVALIFGGAATILAAGLAGGVFVALVKARDAFAVVV